MGVQILHREQFRDGPLLHLTGAGVPGRDGMLAHVASQQRLTPELGGPAPIFRLLAGQANDPGPGLGGDARGPSRAG